MEYFFACLRSWYLSYYPRYIWTNSDTFLKLGALGCGKVLVQLVIEQLEFQRATAAANYDYIALQATDNSIPFYESLGFVRVGAITYDTKQEQQTVNGDVDSNDSPSSGPMVSMTGAASGNSSVADEPSEALSVDKSEVTAVVQNIVSSPNFVHEVVRPGESPNDIAKRYKVCVWDIIFLNKDIYQELRPTSRLNRGTRLHVPDSGDSKSDVDQNCHPPTPVTPTKWFIAKENDTPRKIAKQFGIACKKLVLANQHRLPELQATSRLKAGTRVKVSNLDQQDKICQPYCHWSFPEDTLVESGDPSYMMVYKLDRKTARNPRTLRESLAVPIGKYSPPRLLFPPPPKTTLTSTEATAAAKKMSLKGHNVKIATTYPD